MKYLAIFVASVAVLVGTIVYNGYYPLSSLSPLSPLSPTIFELARIGEKLRIAPRQKIIRALLSFFDFPKREYSFEDTTIAGVFVRIYRPKTKDLLRPALIYFHGGGLVAGSVTQELFNRICSTFAVGTNSTVISVEYRLAPEHKSPAGFQDCYDVVTAVINEPNSFGIIKDKIAIGGDSAGGLLAAAVSVELVKENRSKEIAAQLLIYPWLQSIDMTCLTSYQTFVNSPPPLLTPEHMAYFSSCATAGTSDFEELFLSGNVSRYFMDTPYWKFLEIPEGSKCNVPAEKTSIPFEIIKAVVDTRQSPHLAHTVEGSPPTFMASAIIDPLASEGDLFTARLEEAGVSVIQKKYKGHHGFFGMFVFPAAEEAMQDMINYLNAIFYET